VGANEEEEAYCPGNIEGLSQPVVQMPRGKGPGLAPLKQLEGEEMACCDNRIIRRAGCVKYSDTTVVSILSR